MEEREKAKQIGALSPQSGDEAAEMDILNLFQTLALNHCFFYNVEKQLLQVYWLATYMDQKINYGTINVEMDLKWFITNKPVWYWLFYSKKCIIYIIQNISYDYAETERKHWFIFKQLYHQR